MPRESKADKAARVRTILALLKTHYPHADCSLDYQTPWQLLVATILAAQCTDERVNKVTPDLFQAYPSTSAFAEADPEELRQAIRSTGFFRNKAKNIMGAARTIEDDHDGDVPADMDTLLALPGVARKTANVVLGTAFGRNDGIVVDTHVTRLSNRLKLTSHKSNQGDKIEKDLMALIPRNDWTFFAHALVHHGRDICTARTPDCDACPLAPHCPSAGKA
ncbi:MAG: endonuclease III [Planctomycetes bacterium]|jgi:endonuclease-3|nr:endonuclease III [Planctomycetota bacterium]